MLDTEKSALLETEAKQNTFISRVYGWMSLSLLLTAIVSIYTFSNEFLLSLIFKNTFLFLGLIFGELLLVIYLRSAIERMTVQAASISLIVYAILNGLTLSVIFLLYTTASVASTFFVTAATFGVMSAYGYFTKEDLSRLGNMFLMGLVGVIIASVINIFLKSSLLYWLITYAGLFVFIGLTAYDTQKIKQLSLSVSNDQESAKLSIIGALTLYLDFINLFLLLLRVFGRRK